MAILLSDPRTGMPFQVDGIGPRRLDLRNARVISRRCAGNPLAPRAAAP
jgi:hypothetical protein